MANKQYYGIKYPFTSEDRESYYMDVNKSLKDKVRSMIMHLLFTPKNQRIRRPDFGSDLIKFIFEPNDSNNWSNIKSEIQKEIKNYITNVSINDINVLKNENDEHEIFVRIDYSVIQGNSVTTDSFVTKI